MEEEKLRCEDCDRNFKDGEGLQMHNSVKHFSNISKEKTAKVNFKKIKNGGIFIAILILVIIGFYFTFKDASSFKDVPATEINIVSHSNVASHIHSNLKIIIDGQNQLIPSNIGVSQGVMRPLHTHDSSGKIHIESPFKRDFTIGEFFQVWGESFSSSCIFDYCIDGNKGILTMSVNEIENKQFENYIMKDSDEIFIEFESN